jgi:hypothetical protein
MSDSGGAVKVATPPGWRRSDQAKCMSRPDPFEQGGAKSLKESRHHILRQSVG